MKLSSLAPVLTFALVLSACGADEVSGPVADAIADDTAAQPDPAVEDDDETPEPSDDFDPAFIPEDEVPDLAAIEDFSTDTRAIKKLPQLRGANLAGGEFGKKPGVFTKDYIYPTNKQVDYYVAKGMNVFRVPFLWERLQPKLGGPFVAAELARLTAVVDYAQSKGVYVLLDVHNYARYNGKIIGAGEVTALHLANFWWRFAGTLKNKPNVIFGLMNEPAGISAETWLGAANLSLRVIRRAGATQLVTVPGVAWTGGHSWYATWYGSSNAAVMDGIVDPGKNFAVEIHQYLDSDSSGTKETCVSSTVGSERLVKVTAWLKERGWRGFLGELGSARNATCDKALDNIVAYMEARPAQWLGWSYWAGGLWWGDYMYTLEPKDGVDRQQMNVLEKYLD